MRELREKGCVMAVEGIDVPANIHPYVSGHCRKGLRSEVKG